MPRVKRGTRHVKRRKNILKKVKGFRWGRKNQIKAAITAANKAGQHAFGDRRKKKRTARGLWHIKIGAFIKEQSLSYSKFMNLLKQSQIALDKKILADLSENNREVMAKIIESVKK